MTTTGSDEPMPEDVETFRDTVTSAMEIPPSADQRERIAQSTQALIGHLNALLCQGLGHDTNPRARELCRAAYRLLDLNRRPTASTSTPNTWGYLHDVATLTSSLADIYAARHGSGESDD